MPPGLSTRHVADCPRSGCACGTRAEEEADGIRFSYRRLGTVAGVPLLCLQHFTGTMDAWDPAVVDGLAKTRPVIVFNNAGVGFSTGLVPDNVERMAKDTRAFTAALGLDQVDLLGFSLGGFIAQLLAAKTPDLVRKVILAGTAPKGGEEHLLAVVADAQARMGAADIRLPLFFTRSAASQAAGQDFLARAGERKVERDPNSTEAVSNPQARALIDWCAAPDEQTMMAAAACAGGERQRRYNASQRQCHAPLPRHRGRTAHPLPGFRARRDIPARRPVRRTMPPVLGRAMTVETYDALVLGSGEGGKYMAWHLARAGERVAVIEDRYVGGSCPNIACLPSKNIIHRLALHPEGLSHMSADLVRSMLRLAMLEMSVPCWQRKTWSWTP
jgi:pimeloyl-ACP methyl ester carboxylesterase